ncbi:TRNA threonylcarbamoyl adenosine modification protein, SUA5/YciO/YrdC/YwlC family protein [Ceratobasidium theobromae]|uniref:Threonylcarbamoyl-AMP synthase n=1 Tax=Ceratobasidium theobromae TaxID=1582974 RepID=A0A5N5QUP1_9AGAM|nr:TRNA threonylcarbamoyl adenosine modification protein, SUA5/YciO/YrdC/YwlC family protein [Ceratobasidium theobromae]
MTASHQLVRVLACNPSSVLFKTKSPTTSAYVTNDAETRDALQTATEELLRDQLVVFPTETVYGLAANALSVAAVQRIFSAKGRPPDNPLIAHVSDLAMLHTLLPSDFVLPEVYTRLIESFWPGPLTLLFPADPKIVPSIITAGHPTVAVRMPSHPIARALISSCRLPLAAPSANTSGSPSPTRAIHVERDLGARGKVRIILDGGACDVGVESTVVDGLGSDGSVRVLRPGGVTVEQIEQVVGPDVKVLVHRRDYADADLENAPTTPGMKYRHYSPKIPVVLLVPCASGSLPDRVTEKLSTVIESFTSDSASCKVGLLLLADSPLKEATSNLTIDSSLVFVHHSLGLMSQPAQAAQNLFDGLITLEQVGVDMIFVEAVDETKEGLAVMNRVRKAALHTRWVQV